MTASDDAGLASELCVHDMSTGEIRIVLRHAGRIEAPNWTRDGAALIVNAQGRIWRVPLDSPRLVPIDTGFAVACNNDHGVSPDGRTLAISDKTETGMSCIYTLPLDGGAPRRVSGVLRDRRLRTRHPGHPVAAHSPLCATCDARQARR